MNLIIKDNLIRNAESNKIVAFYLYSPIRKRWTVTPTETLSGIDIQFPLKFSSKKSMITWMEEYASNL